MEVQVTFLFKILFMALRGRVTGLDRHTHTHEHTEREREHMSVSLTCTGLFPKCLQCQSQVLQKFRSLKPESPSGSFTWVARTQASEPSSTSSCFSREFDQKVEVGLDLRHLWDVGFPRDGLTPALVSGIFDYRKRVGFEVAGGRK